MRRQIIKVPQNGRARDPFLYIFPLFTQDKIPHLQELSLSKS